MTQWRGKPFFAPRATKQSSCRTLLAGLSRGLAMLGNKNVENPWKSSTTPRCGRCIVAQLSAVLFARRSSSAIARMAEDCEARQHQRPGRRLTDVSLEPVFPSDLDGAQRARHNEIRRRVRRARPIAAANAAADKIPLVLRPSLPPGALILSDTTFVNEVNSAMSRSTHIRACERPTGTILPRRRSCCSARYSCPPAQARCCPAPALPAQGFFLYGVDCTRAFREQSAAAFPQTRRAFREQTDRRLAGSDRRGCWKSRDRKPGRGKVHR
jgi:hypothetical protein